MTPLHEFKLRYLNQLKNVPSFSSAWSIWQPVIQSKMSDWQSGQTAFDLGDHLSEISINIHIWAKSEHSFKVGQPEMSHHLVFEFDFLGTPVVAVRQIRTLCHSVFQIV